MSHPIALSVEFFRLLEATDYALAAEVRAGRCPHCKGPLHWASYPRKPRGGQFGALAEIWGRRWSLCCGRDGCRRRATPPSVRFFGRRVYVGGIVLLASVVALWARRAGLLRRMAGVPARTARRWLSWWQTGFPSTSLFVEAQARAAGRLEVDALPRSLLELLAAQSKEEGLRRALLWLSPLTTKSVLVDQAV